MLPSVYVGVETDVVVAKLYLEWCALAGLDALL